MKTTTHTQIHTYILTEWLRSLIQLWALIIRLHSYFAYNSINFAKLLLFFIANRCELHSNWNDIGNRNDSFLSIRFFVCRRYSLVCSSLCCSSQFLPFECSLRFFLSRFIHKIVEQKKMQLNVSYITYESSSYGALSGISSYSSCSYFSVS